MPRPSQKTDEQLIAAAKDMLKTCGISQINLRQVAKKAGVNLGMFHYHFKTKEAFNRRVLQETYDKFFQEFSLESSKDGTALDQLRGALITLSRFMTENRRLLLGILHDVMNKDRVVLDFVKTNIPRHGEVIVRLVQKCQKEGSLRKLPLSSVMPFLMGANAMPAMMLSMMEHLEIRRVRFVPVKLVEGVVCSRSAIEERVDLALDALGPKKGKKDKRGRKERSLWD